MFTHMFIDRPLEEQVRTVEEQVQLYLDFLRDELLESLPKQPEVRDFSISFWCHVCLYHVCLCDHAQSCTEL